MYLYIDSDDGVVNHVDEELLLRELSYLHVAEEDIKSCFNDALVFLFRTFLTRRTIKCIP
jgi:hypothetical protein